MVIPAFLNAAGQMAARLISRLTADNPYQGLGTWIYQRFAVPVMAEHHRRLADRLVQELPLGVWVLDIGCGCGGLLLELARRREDLHLVGIDPAGNAIRCCRRRRRREPGLGVHFLRARVEALPFPRQIFHAAISTGSFKHWRSHDQGFSEIDRVLRHGGRLLLYELDPEAGEERMTQLQGDLAGGARQAMRRFILPWSISRSRARAAVERVPTGLRAVGETILDGLPLYALEVSKA